MGGLLSSSISHWDAHNGIPVRLQYHGIGTVLSLLIQDREQIIDDLPVPHPERGIEVRRGELVDDVLDGLLLRRLHVRPLFAWLFVAIFVSYNSLNLQVPVFCPGVWQDLCLPLLSQNPQKCGPRSHKQLVEIYDRFEICILSQLHVIDYCFFVICHRIEV